MSSGKINLLIVDDHPIVRDGLKQVLELQPHLGVNGCYSNGQELLDHMKPFPDVILMDLNMPILDGISTTRLIRERQYPVKIILLTMYNDLNYLKRAREVGADGYLLKSSDVNEILEAILLVNSGQSYYPALPELNQQTEPEIGPDRLSSRELEILKLIALGHTSHDIAERLFLSEHTVVTHRKNMMKKLKINKITYLTAFASRHGLI